MSVMPPRPRKGLNVSWSIPMQITPNAHATAAVAAASDAARVNAGFKLDITEHTGVFAFFDGDFSNQGQSYGGTGGLKFTW